MTSAWLSRGSDNHFLGTTPLFQRLESLVVAGNVLHLVDLPDPAFPETQNVPLNISALRTQIRKETQRPKLLVEIKM